MKKPLVTAVIFCMSFFVAASALAGVGTSLMQTAPVVPVGQAELKLQSDIILNRGGGFNLSPHIVTGIWDHYFDVDAFFGTGTTDFQVGALSKFNLLPDVEGQLGLSFLAGFGFIRDEGLNSGLLTLGVLASKKFNVDFGQFVPYSSFEFETSFNSGNTTLPLTLILGSKWLFENTKPWSFYSELGLSLHDSFYLLSVGASYSF